MEQKIQELLNRKPRKWGNVSIKTFEQDMRLLQSTVKAYQESFKELEQLCHDYRSGHVGEMNDSFLVDEVLSILERAKGKSPNEK